MEKSFNSLVDKMQKTQAAQLKALARQVSLQQLYVEEMTRASGDSGLKITRMSKTGSKPYFSNTFAGTYIYLSGVSVYPTLLSTLPRDLLSILMQ